MNIKWIKVVGITATVVGAVANIAGSWATGKETDIKLDQKIDIAVDKKLSKKGDA
jgi:hypothetical protein